MFVSNEYKIKRLIEMTINDDNGTNKTVTVTDGDIVTVTFFKDGKETTVTGKLIIFDNPLKYDILIDFSDKFESKKVEINLDTIRDIALYVEEDTSTGNNTELL